MSEAPNLPAWIGRSPSLARGQRSLAPGQVRRYPLFPVLAEGCPATRSAAAQYPLEVEYDATALASLAGKAANPPADLADLLRPPILPGLSLGEGATPLVPVPKLAAWARVDDLRVKDETRNPTWSHKDRLNLVTVSAAAASGAAGIVVASSGNHGTSAAAYAARAGLACIAFVPPEISSAFLGMLRAYGACIVSVPTALRWPLMRLVVERLGYHPVSNLTPFHTGHPFGPEGYKPIAYELVEALGRAPAAVFAPTGYGELLFGLHKGFSELRALGIAVAPPLYAVEPAALGPLAAAVRDGVPMRTVPGAPTQARSIGSLVSGYRGVLALQGSGGVAVPCDDAEIAEAQSVARTEGLHLEFSSAAGLAGVRRKAREGHCFDGPIIAIATSTGLKDEAAPPAAPHLDTLDWGRLQAALSAAGLPARSGAGGRRPDGEARPAGLTRSASP